MSTPTASIPTPPVKSEPKEVHRPEAEAVPAPANPIIKEPLEKGLVKPMSEPAKSSKSIVINVLVSLLVVAAGVSSGWGLSRLVNAQKGQTPEDKAAVDTATMKVGDIYGNKEINGFRDTAEGVLLKGGMDGEGSHRLLRAGGKSQTVYLTSSVIDLGPFINHKIKIWGDTFAAQKANWLMDVGRVEVSELNAPLPFEE